MKKEIDIHNYPRKLEKSVELVKKTPISEKNKNLILEFRDFGSLEGGIGMPRMIRYMGILKDWAKILDKDFDKATKEDIMKAVRIIQENERYSPWTKATYKMMLKRFYRWLKKTENEHPEEVKWIKTSIKRTEMKMISNKELITEDEVKKLIRAAEHPRDKAFVSVLYESGTRIGELATLQICNVNICENEAVLNVTGKTGPRQISIIYSVPYLMTWMDSHPFKDNENAPLWVNIGSTNKNSAVQYNGIRLMLQRLFAKIGLKKRFNPHMFRHSRATFLANHFNEFEMNQYFGWIQGSKMPSTYIHMNGQSIRNKIMELNGMKEPEVKQINLKATVCPRCSSINDADNRLCNKCLGVLDFEAGLEVKKVDSKREKFDLVMDKLMKDSEFAAFISSKIKKLGLGDV